MATGRLESDASPRRKRRGRLRRSEWGGWGGAGAEARGESEVGSGPEEKGGEMNSEEKG